MTADFAYDGTAIFSY